MLNVAHDPAVNSQVYSHRPPARADQGGGSGDFGSLVDSNTVAADRDVPAPAPQDRPVRQASDNDRADRRDARADADTVEKPWQTESKTGVLNQKTKKSASHSAEKDARTGVVTDKPKLKSEDDLAGDVVVAVNPATQTTPDASAVATAVVAPPAVSAESGEAESSSDVPGTDAAAVAPAANPMAVAITDAAAVESAKTESASAADSVSAEKPGADQTQVATEAAAGLLQAGEGTDAASQPVGVAVPQVAAQVTSTQTTGAAKADAVQEVTNSAAAKAASQTSDSGDADAKPVAADAKADGDADDASASDTRADAAKPEAASVKKEQASAATGPAHARHGAEAQGAKPDVSFQAALDLQAPATHQAAQPQQQFTVTVAGPTVSAQAASIPVPVNGLAVDIATRAAAGNTSFQIRLDPADLGRIDVRLDVDKHGRVTSHLTVEQPATLDMLRRDAPQLQRALEDAGLKTGDGGLQFSLRDQSPQGRDDGAQSRASHRLIVSEDVTAPPPVVRAHYGRALGSSTGVDISI